MPFIDASSDGKYLTKSAKPSCWKQELEFMEMRKKDHREVTTASWILIIKCYHLQPSNSKVKAPNPLCLIQFWSYKNSLFSILALWGNKNWPPGMKVKKMVNFQNKRGLKGSRWSSLNAPSTGNPLSHPILKLHEFPFPIIGPLGVIRIGLQVWKWKNGKFP